MNSVKRLNLLWSVAILKFCAAVALIACVLSAAAVAADSSTTLSDAQIRAGFLYNFATFVEWPNARPDDPLVVAVLGDDSLAFGLKQTLYGRKVNGRKITVKAVDEADNLESSSILYIGLTDDRSAAAALARVAQVPVLTVGESARFTQIGGIVRMYREDTKLRFEVNLERSHRVQLRFSSKLLSLGKIIKEAR